jgi:hypothetical protein
MLTTMTTVLGLAPLLFERSSQAQFLKPTVITLVYGLGFGMVLVLPMLATMPAMLAAFGLFIGGMAAAILIGFITVSLGMLVARRQV